MNLKECPINSGGIFEKFQPVVIIIIASNLRLFSGQLKPTSRSGVLNYFFQRASKGRRQFKDRCLRAK